MSFLGRLRKVPPTPVSDTETSVSSSIQRTMNKLPILCAEFDNYPFFSIRFPFPNMFPLILTYFMCCYELFYAILQCFVADCLFHFFSWKFLCYPLSWINLSSLKRCTFYIFSVKIILLFSLTFFLKLINVLFLSLRVLKYLFFMDALYCMVVFLSASFFYGRNSQPQVYLHARDHKCNWVRMVGSIHVMSFFASQLQ